jgi:hypothetical protein
MFWSTVSDVAAVITILGLPYLVVSYRKRAPRFSFSFAASSREEFTRDGIQFSRCRFVGLIKNESLDPNSIERIHLVIWKSKRKRGSRMFGYVPSVRDSGAEHPLPLRFDGRQGRQLELSYEVPMNPNEAELFRAVKPFTPPSGNVHDLPKYELELAFEDISGNLFDRDGLLRNRRGIDLRWTLENTFRELKDGHPLHSSDTS